MDQPAADGGLQNSAQTRPAYPLQAAGGPRSLINPSLQALDSGGVMLSLSSLLQIHLGDDQRVNNVFWVDAKSRHNYGSFCDVVSVDTTYVRNKYKMPLAIFVRVNEHYQYMVLGCALISDESAATFSWLMETWLRAMGGQAPKVLITELDVVMNSIVPEIFPNTRHCLFLWHVLMKVSENLGQVVKQHANFMPKFEKCIINHGKRKWAPTYMTDVLLARMSTSQRADSINAFFEKYMHKKTSVLEFLKLYDTVLQDRCEEEAKADSETWNKQPMLWYPS